MAEVFVQVLQFFYSFSSAIKTLVYKCVKVIILDLYRFIACVPFFL